VASTIVPRLLEVVPVPRPISLTNQARGFAERPIDSLADVVAHELAHSAPFGGLNDEYGRNFPGPGPDLTAPHDVTFVEGALNTELLENAIAGGGPGLDLGQIKWNLERVEGAARVVDIKTVGSDIEISINAEDALRWPQLQAGRPLVLRRGILSGPGTNAAHVGSDPAMQAPMPVKLVAFDLNQQTIRCSLTIGILAPIVSAAFPRGSVIIAPRLDNTGSPLTMIDPAVANVLVANGPINPSDHNQNACTEHLPIELPDIPFFRWPAHHLRAIAAYEVGARFNCGVIRPTADCKMRTVDDASGFPVDFCHICKYVIANSVDPATLVEIDKEYP